MRAASCGVAAASATSSRLACRPSAQRDSKWARFACCSRCVGSACGQARLPGRSISATSAGRPACAVCGRTVVTSAVSQSDRSARSPVHRRVRPSRRSSRFPLRRSRSAAARRGAKHEPVGCRRGHAACVPAGDNAPSALFPPHSGANRRARSSMLNCGASATACGQKCLSSVCCPLSPWRRWLSHSISTSLSC